MDTRLLEYLVILEQEGNLSNAAEKIHISQSALSQNLNKLEQKLQTPLFIRNSKRWIPTDAGKYYLEGAKEMIQIHKETYDKIHQLAQPISNTCIHLALCSQIYYLYSDMILETFKKTFPEHQLELQRFSPSVSLEYLLSGSVDAAILYTNRISSSQLSLNKLYHEKFVLAVPNEMAWDGTIIDWNLFARCPFIMPLKHSKAWNTIQTTLKKHQISFKEYYEAGSSIEMIHLLERGYGAALLPERTVKDAEFCHIYPWSPAVEYDIQFAYATSHPNHFMLERLCCLISRFTT